MIFVKTQRLILRNLEPMDAESLFGYRSNEDCARYQRWSDVSLPAVICMIEKHRFDLFPSDQEEQHYAISIPDKRCIGDISCFFNGADNCITLGVTITPEQQRKGYAFEILGAVIASIKKQYPQMDIVALIHPKNKNSILLFEKLGFILECYAESIDSYVYTIFGKEI